MMLNLFNVVLFVLFDGSSEEDGFGDSRVRRKEYKECKEYKVGGATAFGLRARAQVHGKVEFTHLQ